MNESTSQPSVPATETVRTTPVLDEAPVLAHVVRGGFVESEHRGTVVVTAPDGTPELTWGIDAPVFPRSSNKPMQAVAMVRAGLDLPDDLLALASASHSGEEMHRQGVLSILERAGLGLDALQNTPDLPLDEEEKKAWLRSGRDAERITQNCSGKHAGMLATCRVNGWDLSTYRDPQHPLQRAMATTIEELAGEPVAATATDGCGAPVMAISLTGLARAFGRMAAAQDGPERRVAEAVRAYPEMLGGTGRDVTALLRGTPGAIAKDGAEAVYAVGLEDGRGIALKVVDGANRARPVILAAVLRRLGVASAAYDVLEHAPVLGHGEPVGRVEAVGI